MLVDGSIKDIRFLNGGITEVMSEGKVLWEFPQDDKIGAPGNRTLLAGNMDAGWFGEVSSSDFITGDELARTIGLTAGVSQYSDEPWLKFAYRGIVEFVSKKPIRSNLSWTEINHSGCVFGQKIVEIKGKKYKVRLLKGKTEGKQTDKTSFKGDINKGSEWNHLMLPIHVNAPQSWKYKENVNIPTDDWGVNYTDNDLITDYSSGNGTWTWCQECGQSSEYVIYRGGNGISFSGPRNPTYKSPGYGWRPCLELIG